MSLPEPAFDVWDDRPTALLIHGSFAADPAHTWRAQRPLATRARLLLQHRRGYGRSAARTGPDFGADVADALALIGSGAHLVGFSYGGIVEMLAAAARPDLVRSLALIEPPAFGVARHHPEVAALVERFAAIYPAERLTPEAFRSRFLSALSGVQREVGELAPDERRATIAAMSEAPPWEAPLDLPALAAAPFPKLIFSGGWNVALDQVAAELTRELRAEHVVLPGFGHAVQAAGEPVNARLLAFWRSADAE